jgi:hypothetical protein
MRFTAVFPLVVLVFACASRTPAPASNSTQLAFCPAAKFANCTQAKCTLNNDEKTYTCWCVEDNRYSATVLLNPASSSCKQATSSYLQSRYYPTTSYQLCDSSSTNQKWAWCLGVPCAPGYNPSDPTGKANINCQCTLVPSGIPLTPYIVTTDTWAAGNCSFQYWSSATPDDVTQATTFLRMQPGLANLTAPAVLQPPRP